MTIYTWACLGALQQIHATNTRRTKVCFLATPPHSHTETQRERNEICQMCGLVSCLWTRVISTTALNRPSPQIKINNWSWAMSLQPRAIGHELEPCGMMNRLFIWSSDCVIDWLPDSFIMKLQKNVIIIIIRTLRFFHFFLGPIEPVLGPVDSVLETRGSSIDWFWWIFRDVGHFALCRFEASHVLELFGGSTTY